MFTNFLQTSCAPTPGTRRKESELFCGFQRVNPPALHPRHTRFSAFSKFVKFLKQFSITRLNGLRLKIMSSFIKSMPVKWCVCRHIQKRFHRSFPIYGATVTESKLNVSKNFCVHGAVFPISPLFASAMVKISG